LSFRTVDHGYARVVNKAWIVESLAEAAGMSPSAFAVRFKELTNQTPLNYLTEWSMQKG
jgi:AraC-like DNA-binding protein